VDGRAVAYDALVLATGATHGYFGREEWAAYAPGLKSVQDATSIRSRILDAFEQAEATDDPAARASLLTFLIVGAGPTGVETAGAIAELARNGMAKDFRNFASTGRTTGACPGYRRDHVVPLACGGPDAVRNMQWQTIVDARAKDRWERRACGR